MTYEPRRRPGRAQHRERKRRRGRIFYLAWQQRERNRPPMKSMIDWDKALRVYCDASLHGFAIYPSIGDRG